MTVRKRPKELPARVPRRALRKGPTVEDEVEELAAAAKLELEEQDLPGRPAACAVRVGARRAALQAHDIGVADGLERRHLAPEELLLPRRGTRGLELEDLITGKARVVTDISFEAGGNI